MSEVRNVTPEEAWEILQGGSGAVLIDVRTKMEYDYVGHPKGASHVPWQEWPEWRINPHFVTDVRTSLIHSAHSPETIPVLTLCRSGQRSLAAAQALSMAGFAEVYNIIEGFEGKRDTEGHRNTLGGWRFRGLPWEQT
ncbi:MAG: rhodanese-like domain-containing protein [Gammaproteobacteria bacterium]